MNENNKFTENILQPDTMFAEVMDNDSKVEVVKVSGKHLCQILFSSMAHIFDTYSSHKEKNPSFKDFKITNSNFYEKNPVINITFSEDDKKEYNFSITIVKIGEDYKNKEFDFRIDDEIVYVLYSNPDTRKTSCELMSIDIPNAFIDSGFREVINKCNVENYKDFHDTIFAYNMLFNIVCVSITVCDESDEFSREKGYLIAYKKAIRQKISNDIKLLKKHNDVLSSKISEYEKTLTSNNKTIRKCKKQISKINGLLTTF